MTRYTICVDFDGVLHSYDSPYIARHVIPDPPVKGALCWLYGIIQKFDVVILSSRTKTWRGRHAIRRWLKENAGNLYWPSPDTAYGIESVKLQATKPPALVYLDDRALRFTGDNWPTVDEIHRLRPWHKAEAKE